MVDYRAVVERLRRRAEADPSRIAEGRAREQEAICRATDRYLEQWGVPERIRSRTEDYDGRHEAWQYVDQWRRPPSPKNILILAGAKGTGKSLAAGYWLTMVAAELAGRSDPPRSQPRRWYHTVDLARVSMYEGDAMDSLAKVPHLVVDDLGAEYQDVRGALQSRLDWLIEQRHARMKRTVITTNLNAKDFAARYGERIIDRLRESGRWYGLSGKSMRGKG
jgi:hypothetical protein